MVSRNFNPDLSLPPEEQEELLKEIASIVYSGAIDSRGYVCWGHAEDTGPMGIARSIMTAVGQKFDVYYSLLGPSKGPKPSQS